eukprot:gene28243-31346_t
MTADLDGQAGHQSVKGKPAVAEAAAGQVCWVMSLNTGDQEAGPRPPSTTFMSKLADWFSRAPRLSSMGSGTVSEKSEMDPIMEEVMNSTFSLKIMVSRRGCIAQLDAIEDFSEAGVVVVSREVAEIVGDSWEIEPNSEGDIDGGTLVSLRSSRTVAANTALTRIALGNGSDALSSMASHPLTSFSRISERSSSSAQILHDALSSMASHPLTSFSRISERSSSSAQIPHDALSSMASHPLTSFSRISDHSSPSAQIPHDALSSMASHPLTSFSRISERSSPSAQIPRSTDKHGFEAYPEHVQRRVANLLRMHVLGSVRTRVEEGHLDYVNEIRRLTCLFLGFPSLSDEKTDCSHEQQVHSVQFAVIQVQEVMRKYEGSFLQFRCDKKGFVQEVMRIYDGSFLQFRCDEKGFVGICAFGLPGHTHEDNPARGIQAALDLHKRISDVKHRVCVGVTTGDLLCTCVGARKIRSEYTVFGDAINLSARLMGKAKAVVVYRVTPYDDVKGSSSLKARKKGAPPNLSITVENSEVAPERPLVGRDAKTVSHPGSSIRPGMGKTKLLVKLRKSLDQLDQNGNMGGKPLFHLLSGVADVANKSQKLHPWRRILQDIFITDQHRGQPQAGSGALTARPVPRKIRFQCNGSATGWQLSTHGTPGAPGQPQAGSGALTARPVPRKKQATDGDEGWNTPASALGNCLASKIPGFNAEWRRHLSELLDIQVQSVPRGTSPLNPVERLNGFDIDPGASATPVIGVWSFGVGDEYQRHGQRPCASGGGSRGVIPDSTRWAAHNGATIQRK